MLRLAKIPVFTFGTSAGSSTWTNAEMRKVEVNAALVMEDDPLGNLLERFSSFTGTAS